MSIAEWLKRLGLEQYATAFADHAIGVDTLGELTDADLASIGVRLGDRKRILRAAMELAAASSPARTSADAPIHPTGQRRQVTILFSDLCGFTELSSRQDPEETHRLLNSYFGCVDAIVENYGGTVDKHLGDNVMAVFGAPVAHSDDPERALRAAAEIHDALRELSSRLGVPLKAHIGIASGQVVASQTGSDRHTEYTVTGDAVNLAARLDDLAGPDETLVADAVRSALAHLADFAPRGDVAVQGLAVPVRIWAFKGFADGLRRADTPEFIGRTSELRQLQSLAEGVLSERSGQIVLLRGEAGIGKSRLVGEFADCARARGFGPHLVHIVDFGAKRGPRALRDLVSSLLGLPSNSAPESRRRARERVIAARMVDHAHSIFLEDLLDLPQPDDRREIYAAMASSTRLSGIRETLRDLVVALAGATPTLIVIEDVHWADQFTLDVLTGMADGLAGAPALLVLTSRIEGWTLSQDYFASLRSCPLTAIELQPLRLQDALRLAATMAQDHDRDLSQLVERAGGNPLFLEQMLRSLSHDDTVAIPDTVHAVVLARIDRLPEADRAALLAASVLGDRFDLAVLRELIGAPSYACDTLIRHRLLRVEGDEHVFGHALIRESVGASLLRDRRRTLHLKAAESYRQRDLILLAEHLDRAESPTAAAAYLAAAQDQCERVRYEQALRLARRGAEVASGTEVFVLQMLVGDLLRRLGRIGDAIGAFRSALDAAADDTDRCRALIGIAEGQRITESYDELLETLAAAEAAASTAPLAQERARICQLRGGVHFVHGEMEACLAENERSLEHARAAASRELEARALGNLGDAEFAAGRMISAHDRFDQCIVLSQQHGLENVIAANRSMRGQALLYLCRPQEALSDCEASLSLARRLFDPRAEVVARLVGIYVLELIDSAETRTWAEAGMEAARRIGATRFEHVCREYLGRVVAQEGDRAEAERLVSGAVEVFRQSESGMRFVGGRAIGSLALVSRAPEQRRALLAEGEVLLRKRVGAHNPLWFYRDAIEVSLDLADWGEAERYARALESYTQDQPLPWSRFFAARGYALATAGRGENAEIALLAAHEEARRIGFVHTLARIEAAL